MTLGVNAVVLNPQSGGLGLYILKLIEFLVKTPQRFDARIFVAPTFRRDFPHLAESEGITPVPLSAYHPTRRIVREPFVWPGALQKNRIDLFHSPMSYIPLGVGRPAIVTIHDLRSFHFPDNYGFLRGAYLARMIRRSVHRAVRIIAISEFTKNDMVEIFRIDPAKITVIHQGMDPMPFRRIYRDEQVQAIRKKYQLPSEYILSVGHLEPRKNYSRLIEAYAILKKRHKFFPDLVIVGRENWKYQEIYQTVARLQMERAVHFTHFVAADDLPAVYQQARAFISASIFEGFGFTPLEAMAAGIPVAVSRITSLPEIVGDAALLFDPLNAEDIALQLDRLVNDAELCAALVKKERENLSRFRWEDCFTKLTQVYNELLI